MLWATDERTLESPLVAPRELMLPTGTAHIVFRLSHEPLRIFADTSDLQGKTYSHGIVGGPRAAPYVRATTEPARSVGAMLRPGVAVRLFGLPGDELSGRHLCLEDLWGKAAREAEHKLGEASSLEAQLDLLEQFLMARLPRVRAMNPAVAHGFMRLTQGAGVAEAVRESGYSHRRFIALFREASGFSPKQFARVMRFQGALELLHGELSLSLVQVALRAGYSDQAHFTREFSEFAQVSPGEYRALAPRDAHHVPLIDPAPANEVKFVQDPRRRTQHREP
jgi:AraC-like DNA-binding protein